MPKLYVQSIDALLIGLDIGYDPSLPNPDIDNKSLNGHYLYRPIAKTRICQLNRSSVSTVYEEEIFKRVPIKWGDNVIWLWEKV